MASTLDHVDPQWAWSPYEADSKYPWNRTRAAHLYRRAGFAANAKQIDEAVNRKPAEGVDQLFSTSDKSKAFESEMDQFGRTILSGGNPKSLSAWWLYRMLHTPDPLLEKTTLFWHGHFATSAAKVTDAEPMLAQNDLLRRHAMGRFGPMVHAISRDVAMLVYLDSATNRKTHPNENFARELMELFCLGVGNYTERDIQQIARCFTGWEVSRGQFQFNRYQHDEGEKSFLGQSGKFGGEDAVRVILEQPAAPRFIVRKLIRYFVFDGPRPSKSLVEPLAADLRAHDFDVGRTIRRILSSRLFFSEHALGRKVRSPIEMGVGLLRSLEATSSVVRLAEDLSQLGHAPFFPPNVKGWDGGRTWINTSTLLGRANLVRRLVTNKETRFGGEEDLAVYLDRQGVKTPRDTVDWLLELLVAVPVVDSLREPLLALAKSPGPRGQTIADVIQAISTLPEFQLS